MHHSKRQATIYLMLAPYLLGLITLVLIPAGLSCLLILTHYNTLSRPVWAGLDNLQTLFQDRLVGIAVANTALYILSSIILRLGGALFLAWLLHRPGTGQRLARLVVYLPTIIPDVAYALIWLVVLNPRYGPLNLLLGAAGLPTLAWLIEPWPARLALVFMGLWQFGEGFILLLVSLRDIPDSLYENAAIDGADTWARFRHITFPLLLPRLLLLSARDTVVTLQASFVPALVMTNGGPGYATLFIPLYAYFLAFDDLRFGYAATLMWATYALTMILVAGQYVASRRWQYQGEF